MEQIEASASEEIDGIVKISKYSKAPGENAMIVEMLRVRSGEARRTIYRIVNKVCEEEMMANKWRTAPAQNRDITKCEIFKGMPCGS